MNENEKIVVSDQNGYGTMPTDTSNDTKPEPRKPTLYRRLFPRGLKKDTKAIIHLTWPLTVCQFMQFLFGPISLVFAGHIGNTELAAVALAISVLNVTGISVMVGLGTVCETLMSNAFGSINKTLVGVYAQRAMFIMPLFCCPCWALHVNAKKILTLLGQEPEVAELAEQFLLVFAPGLLFVSLHQVLLKYLVTQNIVIPNVVAGILANLGNLALQYLFVNYYGWGVVGCAAAMALGFFIFFSTTLMYILIFKAYKTTWAGWSWKSLEDWGMFVKLALAGLVMVAIEWWTFECGIFMSGIISTVYLSANSLVFNLESLFYTLPMSFGVAVSVRVGQFLGAGDAIGAKNAARVTQLLAVVGFLIEAIIILAIRNYIPYVFTNDTMVANMVTDILIYLLIVLGLDAITATTTGIMRGAGRQLIGALANVFGYFLSTIPLAAVFMFVLHYGASGFWYALIIGVTPLCIIFVVMQSRFNWQNEADRAQKRVGVFKVTSNILADTKSGEFNLKVKSGSKCGLLCRRLTVVLAFLMVFGAGLIARFTSPALIAFPITNSSYITNNSSIPTTPIN